MSEPAVVHEPDCEGFASDCAKGQGICKSYCYGCDKCEPLKPGDFRVCGECFHVFRTPKDLVDKFMESAEPGRARPAEKDIFFCPVCVHDF